MITKNTAVNTTAGTTLAPSSARQVAALAERVEPEEVGVEAGQAPQAEQQDHQHHDEGDDRGAQAERSPFPMVGDPHWAAA